MSLKYTDGPCGLLRFWICSPASQKYTDGPRGLHFITYESPANKSKGFNRSKLGTKYVT
ncbi:hypothetical protein HanXRQr2_Chr16g0738571 [Helianthus annuus]|uniref:Uncharacterized protein n=1 Tax=Helianthus annuus TaxID=4232 RepID=A0A9K3DRN7_HELAN|nr:hypothetical protein HanXRQr2_Chr16g0738571 [Helianthus annuus]KAJ0820449.1 hypothetical protein HanPSC8_Chr16g0708171 [Helianthus annuus]